MPTNLTIGCFLVEWDSHLLNWQDAKDTCTALGGALVQIRNHKMSNCLRDWLYKNMDTYGDLWIGLFDYTNTGSVHVTNYGWTDGTMLTSDIFQNWASGEPNYGGKCGQLWKATGYGWDNDRCDILKQFLCEYDVC
ncbi:layilin-like [Saccoglossus kowalevskii]|uniref:C-type lectin domain family 4 member M-like n=1 Tax=Saccoglossus kowalevskii TaxID=10224 RepID=A0ABM0MHF0_SACKO|nr:PREDICTED: C-type lectin domain family 4 member M-like [Saccoglossus kowalevskii]